MAKALEGYTDTVVVSFLDIFDKVAQNFPEGYRPSLDVQNNIIKELSIYSSFSSYDTQKPVEKGTFSKN